MPRFIAVAEKPGLSEAEFRNAVDRTGKWRFAKRGWIVKAYCALDKGKLVVECEAPQQSDFEDWLEKNGWLTEDIHRVSYIHEGGLVWPMPS
jgi:hypothetical protein